MELYSETVQEECKCPPNLCSSNSSYVQSLGPYPDEIILTLVDRIWYLICSTGIVEKLFPGWKQEETLQAVSEPQTCLQMRCPRGHLTSHTTSKIIAETQCYNNKAKMISIGEKCSCDKCGKSFTHTRIFVKKGGADKSVCGSPTPPENPDLPEICVCPGGGYKTPCAKQKRSLPLKKSFSLCSLACRKLKQRLTFQLPPKPSADVPWCWSRMRCLADGTKILEIYNYSVESTPSGPGCIKETTYPQMIFIMLTSGIIIPFETLQSGH